ncbi:hypothetical protein FDG2_1404 [Candidatus Protofrankia californiensis]|uniref:Uncharacterized protein n=1 Tax=Candidatus Protofrankia californiensis TaxID=1839754 RepID=A0A1C3NVJ1_9ACTN|nr:hypothetical protein FDG2_1404 [Candidatus Protofrankia californiensis]
MTAPTLTRPTPPAGAVPAGAPAGYPVGDIAAALRWLAAETLRLHDLVLTGAPAEIPAEESPAGGWEPALTVADVRRLCADRGWSNGRLMLALRRAADARGTRLPDDEHLKRTVSRWRNGRTGLSVFYADLLGDVFDARFTPGRPPVGLAR